MQKSIDWAHVGVGNLYHSANIILTPAAGGSSDVYVDLGASDLELLGAVAA